ncbi:hypothetical protein BDR07DRAFT_1414071 [Suillus spraguei]|nr:hypothetical protein BDR07DRAFT_1414071 [Suillus spraguei]
MTSNPAVTTLSLDAAGSSTCCFPSTRCSTSQCEKWVKACCGSRCRTLNTPGCMPSSFASLLVADFCTISTGRLVGILPEWSLQRVRGCECVRV